MEEIIFNQTGQSEDGTPIFGKPEQRKPSLLGGLASFAVSHIIGTFIFMGVGCILASIWPPLVGVFIIGLACMREY